MKIKSVQHMDNLHTFAYLRNIYEVCNFLLFFTQSVSFLHKYLRLRGPCQESYYNIARLFHQLGNNLRGYWNLSYNY